MRFLILFFLPFITYCSKPNPNPELIDPIYLDIQADLVQTKNKLAEAENLLVQRKSEHAAVIPQTGQIKYAKKHLYEAEASIEKIKQEVKFIEIRLKSRLIEDRKSYLLSYKNNKPWPDPDEHRVYLEKKRLSLSSRTWSVDKRKAALKK